jgi:hypothetical protein
MPAKNSGSRSCVRPHSDVPNRSDCMRAMHPIFRHPVLLTDRVLRCESPWQVSVVRRHRPFRQIVWRGRTSVTQTTRGE